MPQKDVDAQSGRLSVVTERSEEEHTLTSMRQRRQLLKEFAEYQKKQEEGGAVHILLEEEDPANLDAAETEAFISHRGEPRESTPDRSRANHKENEGEEEDNDQANK